LEVEVKVVIVGAGDIGMELARILTRREANKVVMVEEDEARSGAVAAELDALVLHGDGTHPDMLSKAGISDADALVAVTGSDAINTVIAMLGHRAGISKVVVKLNDLGLRAACQEIGVTDIIAPKIASAGRIVSVLYGFHRLDFSLAARGGLQLIDLPADALAGKTLAECAFPPDVLVVTIMRQGETLLARGPTKLKQGDTLLILVENEGALKRVRALLEAE
jgi:trk system potassium uptake protein TrkA